VFGSASVSVRATRDDWTIEAGIVQPSAVRAMRLPLMNLRAGHGD
jgi:hypothetical protein